MKPKELFYPFLKRTALLSWVLKLINIPVTVFIARLTSNVVSKATDGDIAAVVTAGVTLLSLVLGYRLFALFTETAYEKRLSKAQQKCKLALYRQFLKNPLNLLYQADQGDAKEKLVDDFKTETNRYTTLYPEFWTGLTASLVYLLVLGLQSPLIALLYLALSLTQIFPPIIVKKYLRTNYQACRDIEAKLTDYIVSGYRGFTTIKLFALKSWWLHGLKDLHHQNIVIGNKVEATAWAEDALERFMDAFLQYGSYLIAGLLILLGKISLPLGIQAIALAPGLFSASKTVFSQLSGFNLASAASKRLSQWFTEPHSDAVDLRPGAITLNHITLSHDERSILKNATATLPACGLTLIKGANGIGKSTLFRLLTGLSLPQSGKIDLGGTLPVQLADSNFPSKLLYLPQEDPVFSCAPRELIQMITPERAEAALKIAAVFALSDVQLQETALSELSGGERKKVFLSIAFAMDPPLLLLDEPTNSLDAESKGVLLELLHHRSGCTLLISHEELFDAAADCIYTIETGGLNLETANA